MKLRIYADVKVKINAEDIHKSNVIYCLTFENGKKYVGLTTQPLDKRLYNHCNSSFNKKDKGFNTKKARAIRKYMTFEVSVLYEGDDLNEKEMEFIKEFDSFNNGYNTTLGGEGCLGCTRSDEVKEKMSKIHSTPEMKETHSIKAKQTWEDKGYNFMKPKKSIKKEIEKERLERESDPFYLYN